MKTWKAPRSKTNFFFFNITTEIDLEACALVASDVDSLVAAQNPDFEGRSEVTDCILKLGGGNLMWSNFLAKRLMGVNKEDAVSSIFPRSDVQEYILEEIQAFSKAELTVVNFAAVMGTAFGQSFLFALLPPTLRRRTNLADVFHGLVQRGYLQIHTCYMENDATFSIRNERMAEIIRNNIEGPKMKEYHMKIGSLIEKTFEHDVRPMLQHLTFHFQNCGNVDRYLTYVEIAIKSSLRVRATEIGWTKLEDALREIIVDYDNMPGNVGSARLEQLSLMLKQCFKDIGVKFDASKLRDEGYCQSVCDENKSDPFFNEFCKFFLKLGMLESLKYEMENKKPTPDREEKPKEAADSAKPSSKAGENTSSSCSVS